MSSNLSVDTSTDLQLRAIIPLHLSDFVEIEIPSDKLISEDEDNFCPDFNLLAGFIIPAARKWAAFQRNTDVLHAARNQTAEEKLVEPL